MRANPLTPQLRLRLTDYIVDRMDQRPARFRSWPGVTGLSPNLFCAERSRGQQDYRRISMCLQLRPRARGVQLLHHSTHPLADIAASVRLRKPAAHDTGDAPAAWAPHRLATGPNSS